MKFACEAARDGLVEETWAKEHHEIRFEEMKAGKSSRHFAEQGAAPALSSKIRH